MRSQCSDRSPPNNNQFILEWKWMLVPYVMKFLQDITGPSASNWFPRVFPNGWMDHPDYNAEYIIDPCDWMKGFSNLI